PLRSRRLRWHGRGWHGGWRRRCRPGLGGFAGQVLGGLVRGIGLAQHWRRQFGQHGLLLAGQQRQYLELAPEVLLLAADVVVLGVGLERGLHAVTQDLRLDEDHQVGLDPRRLAYPEELADERYPPEKRHALLAAAILVLDQPAQHNRAAVLDQQRG